MSAQLKLRNYLIEHKKAHRYINEMAIAPIYPNANLSKDLKQAQVVPYLLRDSVITYYKVFKVAKPIILIRISAVSPPALNIELFSKKTNYPEHG